MPQGSRPALGLGVAVAALVLVIVGAGLFLVYVYRPPSGPRASLTPSSTFVGTISTTLATSFTKTTGSANTSKASVGSSASESGTGTSEMTQVSGSVSATGSGTAPTSIRFEGEAGSFVAPVSAGRYSVSLPGADSYTVTIDWRGAYSWQAGTVTESQPLNLGSGSSPVTKDWTISTPDSTVTVSGSVTVSEGIQAHATSVTFLSAAYSLYYTAPVSNLQFSYTLPNFVTYQVTISWTDYFGITGSCAEILYVMVPPGATFPPVSWNC